jgi:hypothetical protein
VGGQAGSPQVGAAAGWFRLQPLKNKFLRQEILFRAPDPLTIAVEA